MSRHHSIASAMALALLATACSQATSSAAGGNPQASSTAPAAGGAGETASAATAAGGSPCQAMLDALVKLASTPSHQVFTGTDGGRADTGEAVTIGQAMYLNVDGKWHKAPFDAQQTITDLMQSGMPKTASCRRIGPDSVDGQPATVYASHDVQDATDTVDTQLWVSDASGLPLKQTIDIDVGGGAAGKSHKDVRFDYANVQPPAAVAPR